MTRCMLIDSGFEKKYWGEAVLTANYIQNRLPSRMRSKSSYEYWHGTKPNFKEIHKFGCQAYVHIPGEKRQKLDNKAEKLFFVGYSEESKAYRLINLKTDKITISRDVIFMENISIQEETKEFNENNENKDTDIYIDLQTKEEKEEEPVQQIQQDQRNENNLRRSKRENKGVPPAKLSAYVHITKEQVLEPRSVAEALAGINKEEWQRALDEEYSSLLANNTWEITELPKGAKAIGCKWVFKLKRDANRNIVRYKTRLVALGCNQNYKIDYEEIFAPVVRQTTLRMLLSIAGKEKMIVKHYDIKNAFLNGNLKEIIYMKQPKGYEIQNQEHLVLRLNKSIYGLKQSANNWNTCISNNFCKACTSAKQLVKCIKQLIHLITISGFKVVATVCDQGQTNASCIRSLLDETKLTCIKDNTFFCGRMKISGQFITPIFPPHLIKGIRNNLLTKDIEVIFPECEKQRKNDNALNLIRPFLLTPDCIQEINRKCGNSKNCQEKYIASWDTIELAYEIDKLGNICIPLRTNIKLQPGESTIKEAYVNQRKTQVCLIQYVLKQ